MNSGSHIRRYQIDFLIETEATIVFVLNKRVKLSLH